MSKVMYIFLLRFQ